MEFLSKPPVPIDDFEKEVIRTVWRKSANPKSIAKVYRVPVETILDVLGLPHDEKKWMQMHKETCFLDHGNGDKEINIRMNWYGEFLQEGDFEKYQPACDLPRDSNEYLDLWKDAHAIPPSDDPIKEARRLWIMSRFVEFQSAEWVVLRDQQIDLFNKFPGKQFDWFRNSKELAILDE